MPEAIDRIEARLPCPVCLGVVLEKVVFTEVAGVQLDHCRRCGGVWFDAGEVQQLRRIEPVVFWNQVARDLVPHRAQCHSCHAFLERSATKCGACGYVNVVFCPQCAHQMHRGRFDDMTLDVCHKCRGIWFDHGELSAIWTLQLERLQSRRGARQRGTTGAMILADALLFDPFVTYYGMHAVAHGAMAAGEVLAHAPEVVGAAAEATAEAATSVFEVILEIIGGIFS